MSMDDDTELRDSVLDALEKNGTLAKLRAQLRASVFLAIDQQESKKEKSPWVNESIEKFKETETGRACCALFLDFLAHFKLDASASVFEAEIGQKKIIDRKELLNQLTLNVSDSENRDPKSVLEILIEKRGTILDRKDLLADSFFGSSSLSNVAQNDSMDAHFKPIDVETDDFFGHSPPFSLPDKISIASTVTQRPKLASFDLTSGSNVRQATVSQASNDHTITKESRANSNFSNFLGDLPEIPQKVTPPSPFAYLLNKGNATKNGKVTEMAKNSKNSDFNGLIGESDESLRLDSEKSSKSSKDSKKTSVKSEPPKPSHNTHDKEAFFVLSKPNSSKSKLPNKEEKEIVDDDLSEEIVEDLEVDDLLNSARSSSQ